VSPVSRKRRPKRSAKPQRRRKPPTLETVHAQLVATFDTFGPDADPLKVEMLASSLLGRWWLAPDDRAVDELDALLGLGVIEYAANRPTPAAMALLRAWEAVGVTDTQREAAATAAARLRDAGVPDPPWAPRLSQVQVGDCWRLADVYGDQAELVCTFRYGEATAQHALLALLDFTGPGVWLKDLFVAEDVPATISALHTEAGSDELLTLTQVAPAPARQLLERALSTMDELRLPAAKGVDEERAGVLALALARCRAMPAPADGAAQAGQDITPIDVEAVVAEFLASPHARDLPQSRATRWSAELIVESLAATDRALRISPTVVADLMHDLSGDMIADGFGDPEAVPPVVTAWTRWAAERNGLPAAAVAELTEVAENLGKRFLEEHDEDDYLEVGLEDIRDPREFAEALTRRRFAYPNGGADLDPADEDGRLELALAEHPDYQDVMDEEEVDGVNPQLHLAMHSIVGSQLWGGDPPEVWPAAKRLLDAGMDRHEVMHQIGALVMEQIHTALTGRTPDTADYRRKLAALGGAGTADPAGSGS
jgi:Domain of unknown function (DUF1841)